MDEKEETRRYVKPEQVGPRKTYIGCKVIQAEEMDECSFLKTLGKDVENRETREGYRVIYPDGYISWSPKEVFEEAYREINVKEIDMAREQIIKY